MKTKLQLGLHALPRMRSHQINENTKKSHTLIKSYWMKLTYDLVKVIPRCLVWAVLKSSFVVEGTENACSTLTGQFRQNRKYSDDQRDTRIVRSTEGSPLTAPLSGWNSVFKNPILLLSWGFVEKSESLVTTGSKERDYISKQWNH